MKSKTLKLLHSNNLFLTGGAGVGKSYLTKEIIKEYKQNSKHIVILGSTGISAVNIGGQTIHSFFAFGICNTLEELILQDRKNKKKIKEINEILKATDLIIIDEISMVSSTMMDMIRYRVQNSAFSGSFLFVGDFFQLPPVIKNSPNNHLFSNSIYAFESNSWEFFNPVVIELNEMKRTKDEYFFEILSKVRVGIVDDEVEEYLYNLSKNSEVIDNEPTYLYGRNAEVNATNVKKLSLHKGKEFVLEAKLTLQNKKISSKRVQSWINALPVEEKLVIKEGIPILFTSNKWGKFYNGERGVVKEVFDDAILIEKDNGKLIKVQRQDFSLIEYEHTKDEVKENVLATISQFPIKLAYAITIHKSQGMSIDNLVCNIDNIFTPSQFYVAIGRAINPKNLYIECRRGDIKSYLKNIIRVNEEVRRFYDL